MKDAAEGVTKNGCAVAYAGDEQQRGNAGSRARAQDLRECWLWLLTRRDHATQAKNVNVTGQRSMARQAVEECVPRQLPALSLNPSHRVCVALGMVVSHASPRKPTLLLREY